MHKKIPCNISALFILNISATFEKQNSSWNAIYNTNQSFAFTIASSEAALAMANKIFFIAGIQRRIYTLHNFDNAFLYHTYGVCKNHNIIKLSMYV